MIAVPFLFFGSLPPRHVAQRMIDSVRKNIPGAVLYQQTDMDTPAFDECRVIRLPREDDGDIAGFFWQHLSLFSEMHSKFLKLDYDCVVLRDVSHVFDNTEKVILTTRSPNDGTVLPWMEVRHPHNAGVMFANGKSSFWSEVYGVYKALPNPDGWMDGCDALETVCGVWGDRVLDLPCAEYNYTPKKEGETFEGKYILHYKGGRKHWDGQASEQAMVCSQVVKSMAERWIFREQG